MSLLVIYIYYLRNVFDIYAVICLFRYLKLLGKATCIAPNVQILLRQAFPIAVEYELGEGNSLTCHLPPLAD